MGSRNRRALFLTLLSAVWFAGFAQLALAQDTDFNRYNGLYGATEMDPSLVANRPRVSLNRAYLPVAIDLSALMPPPVEQDLASCVAHAVGYATRGYYSAIEHGTKPGDPANTPSPAFIHSQIAGWDIVKPRQPNTELCKTTGSNAGVALYYLLQNGALTNQDVPITRICQPDVTAMNVAKNEYSIQDFKIIYVRKDDTLTDQGVDKIKQSLVEGNPVVIGLTMFRYVADPKIPAAVLNALEAGQTYQGSLGENYGKMDIGHQVVVVGYDDGRQAFKLENSWGTDWADGGFGWISYAAAKADITDATIMVTGVSPPRPTPVQPKHDTPNIAKADQCARVYKISDAGGSTYDGFVETEAELVDLRKQYGDAAVNHVAIRPWPVCETLITLEQPLGAASRPKIVADNGTGAVKFGDLLGFSVTTPNFPSFLYVVYLQADGTAVNLVPRRGPIRQQLAPGTVLKFGDGKDGRQGFRVGAPAGTEAVVAIASRSPLLQLEALESSGTGQFRLMAGDQDAENEKTAADRLYLSLLRTALADTPDPKQAAREVTADVLHVTVSAN